MGRRSRLIVIAAAAVVVLVALAAAGVLLYRQATSGSAMSSAQPTTAGGPGGTQIITVVAVDANGHPANGYRWVPGSPDPDLDDPWSKGLRRVVHADPLPNVHPTATPAPFALLLADGTRCRLRNGGAWGGRDDGSAGAYGCPDESPAVLVPAT